MNTNLPSVKRENCSQQARDIIEMAIMRGELKLGEKLVEEKIAQQLNISRVPVREAFRTLEKYGLVVIKPNNGVWVISPDVNDMEEVYDIRALNQPYALELCFRNSPEKTVRELELQIADFKKLLDHHGDIYDLINQDFKFDEIVFSNCGNKKLIEIWAILVPLLKIGFFYNPYFKEVDSVENNRSHEDIILAFQKGQIEEAKKLLIDHIMQSKQLICESFRKGGKGKGDNK
ncbi:MAG: GntR family transcriptional regulator [Anaerolineaceae bacterium]|jgi:DNA-binding GntR family transcriptional regulator|nr:MAG: GntR family transcriptional regulator [Anaerolineaceae bacterium]